MKYYLSVLAAVTITAIITAQAQTIPAQYLRSCHDIDSDYLTTSLSVENSDWTITHTAFEDSICETPYLNYEVKYKTRRFENNLDMTTLEVSYTALSQPISNVLNQINYCGFSDWNAFEKKIVTGKVCDDFQAPKAGEMIYSIFVTKNNGDDLYLGMASGQANGKSPERRHADLDPLVFKLLPGLQNFIQSQR